jgi:lysyl oxidase
VTRSPVATVLGLLAVLGASACSDTGGADRRSWGSMPAAGTTPAEPSPTAPPTTVDAGEPEPLLPDVTTLPASGLLIEGGGASRVLRFGTTLANVGAGPLETVPDNATPCPPEQRSFVQVIRLDDDGDGRYQRERDRTTATHSGACVLFHPTHEHWHIDGSSRYELLDSAGARVVGTRKVSFCLRDSDRLTGVDGGPRAYEACARDRVQGISPGWGDLYDRDLDGQTLGLPAGLPDGPYCLQMTADPFDYFRESDETNNASRTPLRIRGAQVTVGGGGCAAG